MKIPPPFPPRFKRKEENDKLGKFMAKLSILAINIPVLEDIQEILGYAKLIKKLMSKKNLVEGDTIEVTHRCSAIMSSAIIESKEDPRAFTSPSTIGTHKFEKVLCDLSASINLMPFVIYQRLGLSTPTLMLMRLLMAGQSSNKLVSVLFDVLVKVDIFILPMDFIVLDCEMDQEVPIILGLSFLAIGRAIVDLELEKIRFVVHDGKVYFWVCKMKKQPMELQVVSVTDVEDEEGNEGSLEDPTGKG
ncbi:uncharacterized protein LOC124885830 [Capsicum annuum]|uniref:uncharacterized protein LOC124885830 n=1 Tax=Capsicum annuum TaxID=4072 RepID=UPI001FB082C2|nr:uncharacterized protein LOC124885830 [Capsicum annuum]